MRTLWPDLRRKKLWRLLPATAAAILLVSIADAGSRLIIEWDDHTYSNTLPAGHKITANEHFGPLTVDIGADGTGTLDNVATALSSRVELGEGATNAMVMCHTGEVVNPPVRIKVSLYADGRVALTASHKEDGPCQKLHCSGRFGSVMDNTCVALTHHDVDVYFPFDSLKPGERTEVLGHETETSVYVSREHLWVTLDPCQSVPGSSGNGSVAFSSEPGVGLDPWPVAEHDELTQAQLNVKFPPRDPAHPAAGDTDVNFPDSGDRQNWAPRADVRWNADSSGKGKCVYLDQLALHFPQIKIWIAQEYYAAKGCRYSWVRGHEMRHALHFEDAFRNMQRRLQALLDDPALPTPAHPKFVASEVAEEQLQNQFQARMDAIVREETDKLRQNIATQDNTENYGYENTLCR